LLPLPGVGPEHVTIDGQGRLLTGLADGRIVRLSSAGGDAETLVNTGGRPLGMELDGDDTLIVCDSERGLLRVRLSKPASTKPASVESASVEAASVEAASVEAASVEVLCDSVHGRPLVFCSCPAIAADGTIYFTQSSQRYDLAHYKGDLLEHSGTGRVLRLKDGQVDVLADGLQFANGVVLAPDGSSLAVAETGGYRITRVFLDGDRVGQTQTLAGELPGFPDNLTTGPGGLIWIGMASPRDALLDFLLPRAPWLRAAVWSLPDRLKPGPKNIAWALAIDQSGAIVHDLRGWQVGYHEVTAAREHDGQLYLGSFEEPALARVPLPAAT
jgi:sugar lactone lactonase YvrE